MRILAIATITTLVAATGSSCRREAAERQDEIVLRGGDSGRAQVASECHDWPGDERPPYLLVEPGRVGPAAIGVSRAAISSQCPGWRDTTSYGVEGIPRTVTIVEIMASPMGIIEWGTMDDDPTDDSPVSRILIHSPLLRTADSIGVGTSLSELRRLWGRLTAGYDEAGVYVWSTEYPGLSAITTFYPSELISPEEIAQQPELVPDSAHIRTLVVTDLQD